MNTIYLEPSAVPAVLRGGYKGRQFRARITDTVTLTDTYWDGGTRSTYALVSLATGEVVPAAGRALDPPQFGGAREPIKVEIPPDFVLREHSIFCGKDMGYTFHVRPDNAAKLLPGPVELTDNERAVLEYTATRKSSYMGRNRFQMYCEDMRWKKAKPMRLEEWEAAKADLITRKLLTKAGAITPAGRNACAKV